MIPFFFTAATEQPPASARLEMIDRSTEVFETFPTLYSLAGTLET